MNIKRLISHLNNEDIILSQDELKTCLLEQMTDYIDKKCSFDDVIVLSEAIRKHYFKFASREVQNVVNKLHELQNDFQNSEEKKLSEIVLRVDDFILLLMGES